MSEDMIYRVIVGTAGHIDHGKSSVVKRLTGIDPDRLIEEKSRGLTIDLGFAPFVLADGQRVGIIDVPGHERFIKNMVAGATGIDVVVLVVAADDSVMPQTREHLDIMTLLGIDQGIVVINKIDLVEPELADLVEEEVLELTQGTFLEDAPIYRVSATTGDGFPDLQRGLEEAIQKVPPRASEGVFRMPIQRVFSSKGHGTVVTGVPVAGRVRLGQRLEILPPGVSGRVRGLQAYKKTTAEAMAGHSTAINLSEVDYHRVHRGMVAAEPGFFRSTSMVEARVRVLPHLRQPLRHQTPIRFHTGTLEVVGKVFLLEEKVAEPGTETFAQFRLDEPIVVAPGDCYVFRQESPMLTLGGGEILDRSQWRLKLGKRYVLQSLERKRAALGSREDFLLSLIEESPFQLVSAKSISRHAGLPPAEVTEIFQRLAERAEITVAPNGREWLSREGLELGEKRIGNALEACYDRDPLRLHVPKLEVRDQARLEDAFFEALLEFLNRAGRVQALRGGRLSLPGREIPLGETEQAAYDLVSRAYSEQLFGPPRLEDLAASSGMEFDLLQKVQALLLDQSVIIRISPEIVLHQKALEEGIQRVRQLFDDEGSFSASRAKDVLKTTRKFAIPFLEHLDHLKVTRRVGDHREIVG